MLLFLQSHCFLLPYQFQLFLIFIYKILNIPSPVLGFFFTTTATAVFEDIVFTGVFAPGVFVDITFTVCVFGKVAFSFPFSLAVVAVFGMVSLVEAVFTCGLTVVFGGSIFFTDSAFLADLGGSIFLTDLDVGNNFSLISLIVVVGFTTSIFLTDFDKGNSFLTLFVVFVSDLLSKFLPGVFSRPGVVVFPRFDSSFPFLACVVLLFDNPIFKLAVELIFTGVGNAD